MPKSNIIPIKSLGKPRFKSPLRTSGCRFFRDDEGVIRENLSESISKYNSLDEIEYFELAGPRENIFFKPEETTCGIVTCGGLCPGLNDVVRAITFSAIEGYGVKKVLGFQYGYEGLIPEYGHAPLELTTANTDEIHENGGTILKSSRGQQETSRIVDTLIEQNVDILFNIGGDGTLRAAVEIQEEIEKRGQDIAVVGIPKTIDNDISIINRSFGFETAVEEAWKVINNAHAEAKACRNGLGLVKLMGRDSGWIAAVTTNANSNVNFCLVPEVDFDLRGENGFLETLRRRFENIKDHAVVVVAEGVELDISSNGSKDCECPHLDVGNALKNEINNYFNEIGVEVNVKYFDPGYTIRSRPATANDSEYCLGLGHDAVHAGMAGKTNLVVGMHNHNIVHLPIPMTAESKQIDPSGTVWQRVLQSTRQPSRMINP